MPSNKAAELRELQADFLRMLSHAYEQVVLAADVLLEAHIEQINVVTQLDMRVDELERDLGERCIALLGSGFLTEREVRFVALIYKSLSDVERMGDYAQHVADDSRWLAVEPLVKRYIAIRQIIALIKTMLSGTAQAFTEQDVVVAEQMVRIDHDIDELYEQFYREMVTCLMEQPASTPQALALMRIGRSLQRIGDHVENVSERMAEWLKDGRGPVSAA